MTDKSNVKEKSGMTESPAKTERLKITETVLRDGQQSLIATRMSIDDMLPILEKINDAGYYSIECWGGATFDTCLRYLNEDPWQRLRTLRKNLRNCRLQMLLRGQNLLGYRHYADDTVESFVRRSISQGIDILRIFDALNDLRNVETAVKAAKAEGGTVQLAASYTTGEGYTGEYWINLIKDMESMGADSICIKDMAGVLTPQAAEKLVTDVKKSVKIPLHIHSHCTSGMAPMTYMKAIEAGCDGIDTAISPFAMGTSQPATEVMAQIYQDTPRDTGLDMQLLTEIAEYFRNVMDRFIKEGRVNPKVFGVDIKTLVYQVPGGMLSNLMSQLEDQKAMDKFYRVMEEIPRVRNDLGQPPLVTPTSQIVGTQALLNVLTGQRYSIMSSETKAILHGEYGKTIKDFNSVVQRKAIGDEKPITVRPADLIAPELDKLKQELGDYMICEEDVLTYAMFPQIAADFFKKREAEKTGIDPALYDIKNKAYPV